MDNRIGTLRYTNFYNPLGIIERREWTWEGGPEVYISPYTLDELGLSEKSDEIKIDSYRLKKVNKERDWNHFNILYIRKDYSLWWLFIFWHRISSIFDLIYRRAIITLAVWGLADYNSAIVPSWQDIHFPWRKK